MNRLSASNEGERIKVRYSCSEIELLLEECGYLLNEHLELTDMTQRYFAEYNDANQDYTICAPEGANYIFAVKTPESQYLENRRQ